MEETNPKELPAKYYLDYFEYLIRFITHQYPTILSEPENAFIHRFTHLSEEARCLFVRMMNRRGCFFRVEKMQYAEIPDIHTTVDELLSNGLVESLSVQHENGAQDVLNLYTKPELVQFLPLLDVKLKGVSSLRKPEVVRTLLESVPFEEWVTLINATERVVRQACGDETEMLKFLFFGDLYSDMTEFVLRDLGNTRFEQYNDTKFTPRFHSRKEVEDRYTLSRMYQQFKQLRETLPAAAVYHWFTDWQAQQVASAYRWEEAALPIFEKMALRLGTLLERNRLHQEALSAYQHTHQAPSRERQVRILHKLNLLSEAIALCETIREQPQNADEKFFAIDFHARLSLQLEKNLAKQEAKEAKKVRARKVRKSTTNHLLESELIYVSALYKHQVERGVVHYFEERGDLAVFAENYIWRGFFGVLFWDIIFDEDQQAIHQPLQRAPSDLFSPDFLPKRERKLIERLQILQNPAAFRDLTERVCSEKYGMSNPLVGWHESLPLLIQILYEKLTATQLAAVMLEMARDLRENTRGFPDLFRWNAEAYCFIEVKSPNDTLSAQQLHWLQFFAEVGINAKVLRVDWIPEGSGK